MKKFYLFSLVCLGLITANAQTMKEWDDVSVTSLNRETAHDLAIPFANENEINLNDQAASPYYQSLNGTWKFNWVSDPSKVPTGFYETTYDASAWDNISVPATWQVYGVRNGKAWDKPLYVNTRYPFTYTSDYSVMADRPDDWTYNNSMKNPVGCYRRDFTVPDNWDGRDVYVRFNGAGHGYYVWVNGHFTGYAEDSYLPSEFKISDYLQKGNNTIAVQVFRFTSGSFLECQDYWRLTGITRDVFLWSAPKTQVHDYFFRTTQLTSNNTVASATVTTTVQGNALENGSIEVKVKDGDNVIASGNMAAKAAGSYDITLNNITGITAWSAEQPRLYDLVITLKDGDKAVDIRGGKIGFHTVGIRADGALLINGNRVVIHGVNRHDFSEINGRTVSREETEADIRTMKRLNINAIRTSHYPVNPYFYDLCDRYGMYVLAEADVECHGNQQLSHVEQFRKPMVERSERQVLSLRNHACIFMWSGGNESGNGDNFKYVMSAIKNLDNTRLTHYEGNSEWSDVTSTMYASESSIKSIGEERQQQYNNGTKPKPHIQCENTHAMGNAMGNQREMFDLYEKYPALTGEFIWDWKDQGLKIPVPNSSDKYYWAYGGDFGDNPNDDNFCCNGVVLPDLTIGAKAINVKKIYQPLDIVMKDSINGRFQLKSKLQQRVLDDVNVTYSVLEDGNVISEGTLADISLKPGYNSLITLNAMPETPKDDAEYFIRFSAKLKAATLWADAGYEVASEEFRLRKAVKMPICTNTSDNQLSATKSGNNVTITGDKFTAIFTNGNLSSYTYNGNNLINSVMKLCAFRVPTDNDKAHMYDWDNMGLRSMTYSAGTVTMQQAADNKSVRLTVTNTYKGKTPTAFTANMCYDILSNGTILVSSVIDPATKNVVIPKLGYRLEMPKGYERFTWFGRGPWDNYKDRKESCLEGLYNSTVTDQWTNYVRPQEMGNKEQVRWISLRNTDGNGLLFIAPQQMSATVAHWRAENVYTTASSRKKHPYEVTPIDNTVVSLDAANRALGNASCGSDVLSKYELYTQKTPFSFIIMPLDEELTNVQLAEKARVTSMVCDPVKITRNNNGYVTLSSTTEGATIHYSINGGEYVTYTDDIDMRQGGTISTYCEKTGMNNSLTQTETIPLFIDKSLWRVVSCDSQQGGNEKVDNAIDDDPSTIWHTQYSPLKPECPHEIIVDMGKTYHATTFIYKGRTDGNNGHIKDYEVYFSNNPEVWGSPAATGTFNDSSDPQTVTLTSKPEARYFKLIVKSVINDNPFASAAELSIEADAVSSNTDAPVAVVESGNTYNLKEITSGLYLHYKIDTGSNHEGDFCLASLNTTDASFNFKFNKRNGFSSFYDVAVGNVYMGCGDGNWRCVGVTDISGKNGWMQVETLSDGSCALRGVWMGYKYLNFDSRNTGSYIYSDKAAGAKFKLINIATAIDNINNNNTTVWPMVTTGLINVSVKNPSTVIINNISGYTLASYKCDNCCQYRLDYPNGMYFVKVNDKCFKVILNKK